MKRRNAAAEDKLARFPLIYGDIFPIFYLFVHIEITRLSKDPLPRIPIRRIAKKILPEEYDLSLVIVGDKLAQTLNQERRGKSYIPNVLSFALSPLGGEIFLNLKEIKRQYRAGKVRGTLKDFTMLLIIHSMLHLKGMHHGRTMEKQEENILLHFGARAEMIEKI